MCIWRRNKPPKLQIKTFTITKTFALIFVISYYPLLPTTAVMSVYVRFEFALQKDWAIFCNTHIHNMELFIFRKKKTIQNEKKNWKTLDLRYHFHLPFYAAPESLCSIPTHSNIFIRWLLMYTGDLLHLLRKPRNKTRLPQYSSALRERHTTKWK